MVSLANDSGGQLDAHVVVVAGRSELDNQIEGVLEGWAIPCFEKREEAVCRRIDRESSARVTADCPQMPWICAVVARTFRRRNNCRHVRPAGSPPCSTAVWLLRCRRVLPGAW